MSTNDTLSAIQSAIEALNNQPELLARIDSLANMVTDRDNRIDRLDRQIESLNDRIVTQAATIKSLREDLDKSQFRELELTEERDQALGKLDAIFGIAAPLMQPDPEVVNPVIQSADPLTTSTQEASGTEGNQTSVTGNGEPSPSVEPNVPFVHGSGSPEYAPTTTSPATAENVSADVTTKPYANISFYDVPMSVTYDLWYNNGGREYMAGNNGSAQSKSMGF